MVPNGWVEGTVSDLVESLNAGISVNGRNIPKKDFEKGVLKVSAVTSGVFNADAYKTILEEDLSRAKINPKKGRIIISRSNTENLVGASAYIHKDYDDLFLPDKLWQIEPKPSTDMEWLSYILAGAKCRYTLSRLSTGTSGSMKNITKGELLGLKINIPPPKEQKKIALLLSAWDKNIQTIERLLFKSQHQKKGLTQQLLTGKKRFPEFAGKSWQSVALGDILKERKDSNNTKLRLLSITRDEGVIPREEVGRKDSSSKDKSKYLRILPGDIGYNTMRMWQGVSAVSSYEGIISPAYTVLIPSKRIDATFMSYLFKHPKVIHLFERYSQGLTSDTWNLKYPSFAKIKVDIPEIEEQKKIANVLSECDKEIKLLSTQIEKLKQQKKGMMQQLLTGKTRVKV